jgi:hypothetical protein
VEDLNRQILPLTPHQVLGLLLENLAGPVVRVDDLVALLEVTGQIEVLLEADLRRFFF